MEEEDFLSSLLETLGSSWNQDVNGTWQLLVGAASRAGRAQLRLPALALGSVLQQNPVSAMPWGLCKEQLGLQFGRVSCQSPWRGVRAHPKLELPLVPVSGE